MTPLIRDRDRDQDQEKKFEFEFETTSFDLRLMGRPKMRNQIGIAVLVATER